MKGSRVELETKTLNLMSVVCRYFTRAPQSWGLAFANPFIKNYNTGDSSRWEVDWPDCTKSAALKFGRSLLRTLGSAIVRWRPELGRNRQCSVRDRANTGVLQLGTRSPLAQSLQVLRQLSPCQESVWPPWLPTIRRWMAIDPSVGVSEMAVHNPHNLEHSRAFHYWAQISGLSAFLKTKITV